MSNGPAAAIPAINHAQIFPKRDGGQRVVALIANELPGVLGVLLDAIARGLHVRGCLTIDRQ